MQQDTTVIYDGTFQGLLTAIFVIFEEKITAVEITTAEKAFDQLFCKQQVIYTDTIKAERVWKGLQKEMKKQQLDQFYYAFLSEIKGLEIKLLQYAQAIFFNKNKGVDFGHTAVLRIAQVAKMVAREKHRMEAFTRFELIKDELYIARIDPDFNVLPLIKKHFYKRYANQKWMIYDIKRNYGLFYDLTSVEICHMEAQKALKDSINYEAYQSEEMPMQKLWNSYFNSVNIKSRKNMKLHIRHIPKRYWKYLSEKRVM